MYPSQCRNLHLIKRRERKILARAERRGGKTGKKKEVRRDSSSGSEDGDRDEDSESEAQSPAGGLKKDSQKLDMKYLLRSRRWDIQ